MNISKKTAGTYIHGSVLKGWVILTIIFVFRERTRGIWSRRAIDVATAVSNSRYLMETPAR